MEEGLRCPCSENKGADQLRGYPEADLHLCFHIRKNPVFSWRGSYLGIYMARTAEIFGKTSHLGFFEAC